MKITSAQYISSHITGENDSITVVVNGITMSVPLDPDNTDYQAVFLFKQKAAYEIQAAE